MANIATEPWNDNLMERINMQRVTVKAAFGSLANATCDRDARPRRATATATQMLCMKWTQQMQAVARPTGRQDPNACLTYSYWLPVACSLRGRKSSNSIFYDNETACRYTADANTCRHIADDRDATYFIHLLFVILRIFNFFI